MSILSASLSTDWIRMAAPRYNPDKSFDFSDVSATFICVCREFLVTLHTIRIWIIVLYFVLDTQNYKKYLKYPNFFVIIFY